MKASFEAYVKIKAHASRLHAEQYEALKVSIAALLEIGYKECAKSMQDLNDISAFGNERQEAKKVLFEGFPNLRKAVDAVTTSFLSFTAITGDNPPLSLEQHEAVKTGAAALRTETGDEEYVQSMPQERGSIDILGKRRE